MKKQMVLLVVLLLFFVGIGAPIEDSSKSYPPASQDGLEIQIDPVKQQSLENESTVLLLYISNPPTNGKLYPVVFVGAHDAERGLKMEIGGERPDVFFEDRPVASLEYELSPGDYRMIPIVVKSWSKPGKYTLNATAVYAFRGNHTRDFTLSTVQIDHCPFTCKAERLRIQFHNWIWSYRMELMALAGLAVAILSFIGYERIRNRMNLVE